MGILEYNGSAILAMTGKNCVAIASDTRLGVKGTSTMAYDFQKVFPMGKKTFVGFAGLASDVTSLSKLLQFRLGLQNLRLDRDDTEPSTVASLVGHSLYEKRFGPWMVQPVLAGLGSDGKPIVSSWDCIGARTNAADFACGGTNGDQLAAMAETYWRPEMDADQLLETVSQCLLASCDRDCLSGWGAVVHLITPEGTIAKKIESRQD